ncbi:MAG: monovalent cation/H(+) antiporter subunit G [Planctomycetota bacterium]
MTLLFDLIVVTLVLVGVTLCLLASIGLVRMPDLYNRMQSSAKAGTLGIACVAAAAGLYFATSTSIIEAGLIIMFFFATAPIGSHLIGRAAYGVGVPLDGRTSRDDLSIARAQSARRRLEQPLRRAEPMDDATLHVPVAVPEGGETGAADSVGQDDPADASDISGVTNEATGQQAVKKSA